jgi:uncharacterized protein
VGFFEALTEIYLVPGGKALHYLERIRTDYPIVLHGVSFSIGSAEPLNREHLRLLKGLSERIQAHWISDHLCWTGTDGLNLHDLMPMGEDMRRGKVPADEFFDDCGQVVELAPVTP